MIKTIGFDEQQVIRDILALHCGGGKIDLDPTYSTGNFYKRGIPKPILRSDIDPQAPGVALADVKNLTGFTSGSVGVVMFDPPFTMNGESKKPKEKKTGLIGRRFTSFKDWDELRTMYLAAMKELYRVMMPGGVLIFKCQDAVVGGKNHFTHVWIMNRATEIGFYPKDLFVLLAKSRMTDGREQEHARKFHSYFWIFEKRKSKVSYDSIEPSLAEINPLGLK